MKKIFAIALALVMVLSMASAFAAANLPGSCDWTDWACATNTVKCGVAKAEVVKFVRTNACEDQFVQNDCAAVVKGERVYYAFKVTFDKDVNQNWFDHASTKLALSYKNLATTDALNTAVGNGEMTLASLTTYATVKDGGVFYLYSKGNETKLVKEKDFTSDGCVFGGYAQSTGVKVCANVAYEFTGKNLPLSYGDYIVYVDDANNIQIKSENAGYMAKFYVESGKVGKVEVKDYAADWATGNVNKTYYGYNKSGSKFATLVGTEIKWEAQSCNEAGFVADVLEAFKFDFETCITNDAFEFCATWSANASAVVDNECVVAIPKTGDKSVLAWLF